MNGAEKPPDLHTGPTLHYEGFIEKKGPKDKDYEKQWIMLLGDKMVVYAQKMAQRELNTTKPLEAVVIDKSWDIKQDAKEKNKLTVKCKAGLYKFKMSTPDERDNWWIRFYTLAKMQIPKVHLLPGQIMALQEIIESSRSGAAGQSPVTSPGPTTPQKKTFVKQRSEEKPSPNEKYRFYPEHLIRGFKEDFPIPPTWFFEVQRVQAEELLLNNPEHGAIIIRPCESHSGYALSMRQDPPANNPHARPIVKHFRFNWDSKGGTFRMAIEEKQPEMKTMYDLLAFFIEKHGGNIRPIQTRDPTLLKIAQHPYELGLRVSQKDPENGEARQDTYLQPHRAPEPPSKPRPDRQSLPASFNVAFSDLQAQGATAAAIPTNRLHMATSETQNPSNSSQYVLPGHEREMYVNMPKEKLFTVNEDSEQNFHRRQQRFSTSVVPSFTPEQANASSRPPNPPPPRQRCVSSTEFKSSDLSVADPNSSNLTAIYNTPSGKDFVLHRQMTSPLLPVATTEVSFKQADNRPRAVTSPAILEDDESYLTPRNQRIVPSQEAGNPPLPSATKPSSHAVPTNQHLVFKKPIIRDQSGGLAAPSTSYIHPTTRPRGKSFPFAAEGGNVPQAELDEIFKKFGVNSNKQN